MDDDDKTPEDEPTEPAPDAAQEEGAEPVPDDSAQKPYRKVSIADRKKILKAHQTWLASNFTNGEQADFRRADLKKANFRGADLRWARFQAASLWGADLEKAKLSSANLDEARLYRAKLRGANLKSATLYKAHLRDVDGLNQAELQNIDLREATGLLGTEFAGTDVTGARLPGDIAKFEALDHVAEISKHARNNFLAVLGACVFSWLTIATTTDVALLLNRAETALPIIGAKVPIAGFYWAAPPILLALFLYLHLYLQRMWTGLASLPAVFPDGDTLDRHAYPWLLTSLVNAHVPLLSTRRPPFSRLMVFLSIVTAWLLVPATLGLFWLRYLPRHEWVGTTEQLLLFAISIAFAAAFYWRARATLRGHEPPDFVWRQAWKRTATFACGGLFLVSAAAGITISLGAIEGDASREVGKVVLGGPATWVPYAFDRMGYRTFANFRERTVSTRPEDWWKATSPEKELEAVRGATLSDSDLRYADAFRAFLVKADLRGANLQEADLRFAKLQGADLSGANLQGANLRFAKLQGADLSGANLQGANLFGANLQGADLSGANLQGANLFGANLQGADLSGANLQGANLFGARNLTREQLDEACGDDKTTLPDYLADYQMKPCPEPEQPPSN